MVAMHKFVGIRFMVLITICMLLLASSICSSRFQLDSWVRHPYMRAYLDTIAYAEGTFRVGGYRTLFGGTVFRSYQDHPRQVVVKKNNKKRLSSTAAGRYQILARTWDSIAPDLLLNDFSPINQDRCAVYLIRQMGALRHVLNKEFEHAVKKTAPIWASLPGACYKQRIIPLTHLKKFYCTRLVYHTSMFPKNSK